MINIKDTQYWWIMLQHIRRQQSNKFLIENKIYAVTIPPYEPTLNPAEQLILWLKRRFKMQTNFKK